MPLIEFRCDRCHYEFEDLIMKKNDITSLQCPKCHSRALTRLFSAFGLRSSSGFSSNVDSSCADCAKTSCTGCSK